MMEMTGVYLGEAGQSLQFDLRPHAGTATVHRNNIQQWEPCPRSDTRRLPHRVG